VTELAVLYSFRRCPYAMRARMALLASGLTFELREVSLKSKPAEMIAASAKATVPVLLLANAQVIDESLEIMRWALNYNDPEDWRAGDDKALIAENDGAFKHHLDRYKYPNRHGSDPLHHRTAALAWLALLEQRLTVNANLCRNSRSLTDIAIMPFVRQFAATDQSWFDAQALPGVQRWLQSHITSPLFDAAMQRFPIWQPGNAPSDLSHPGG
jgi:glutathione S-transferase